MEDKTKHQVLIDVAIGLVIRGGQILICRRRQYAHLGGCWEFPGGKCEPGEPPADCVRRELEEEVGIRVRPVYAFRPIEHHYAAASVRLHPFLCEHLEGKPAPLAADELRWVAPSELGEYRFPTANAGLIEETLRHLARNGDGADRHP